MYYKLFLSMTYEEKNLLDIALKIFKKILFFLQIDEQKIYNNLYKKILVSTKLEKLEG